MQTQSVRTIESMDEYYDEQPTDDGYDGK